MKKSQNTKVFGITPGTVENIQNKSNNQDELLTIDEIAAKLKVKKSFLYTPCRRKGPNAIPCIKVGKYLRYRFVDVMACIEKCQGNS